MASHDDTISQFCDLTGTAADRATEYLTATDWNLEAAVVSYFADQEALPDETEPATAPAPPEPEYTGPRTLDGRPAPQYASASSTSKKPQKKKGLATLGSLGGGHDHGHDDDDDDDDDDDGEGRGPRDLFAGGEKSALAVQDPSMGGPSNAQKVIKDIISKAKANASRPEGDSSQAGPSRSARFRGTGQTLGGEGVESRSIPDPVGEPIPRQGSTRSNEAAQERVLHLWQDGFSIDDGELRRFDDPANAADLQMIRQGRAPVHLMNVRYDQPVDVKLQQHDEEWRQLPKVYRPFGGEGRRLGSPVPGKSVAPPPPTTSSSTSTTAPQTSTTSSVDNSQPTLMIRIQMPDGTRLPARFNTTNTVEDVYQFVQRASSATQTRPWVLATTFPSKEHSDRSLVLGDMPEFKRGGTAVVKWT